MSADSQSNNKQIAKNAGLLYVRMLLTLIIGLYTSRVILNQLGIEDYGIYNVIGGIVAVFASLNNALSSSSSRYITFFLGKGDMKKVQEVFSTVAIIHFFLGILIVILCETGGLYFFYNHMQIPEERMEIAFWLLQLSFLTSFLTMINVPYAALIVGHEKFNIYAYVALFDVSMKLLVAILIQVSPIDKLLFYGILLCIVQLCYFLIYRIYCVRNYKESHIILIFDRGLFKEIASYSSWALLGNLAVAGYTQGLNMLLNVFFNPAVNAARGVAVQVQNIVVQFVNNFQNAINPQITKTYAADNYNRCFNLIMASSRYSFFVLYIISMLIILNAPYILRIWLGIVPEHTVNFIRIILTICMFDAISNPLVVAANASGRIKVYNVVVGGLLLLIVPISYIVLSFYTQPEVVFIVHLCMAIFATIARLYMTHNLTKLPVGIFVRNVFINIIKVVLVSGTFVLYIYRYTSDDTLSFLWTSALVVIVIGITILYIGISKKERTRMFNFVVNKIIRR